MSHSRKRKHPPKATPPARVDAWVALSNLSNDVVFVAIGAIVAFVPLWFSIRTNEQFELPKTNLVWTLGAFLLLFWSVSGLGLGWLRRKVCAFDAYVGLYALGLIAATVTSLNRSASLLGSYWNYQSVFTLLIVTLIGWVASQRIRTLRETRLLLCFVSSTAGIVSLYAICQHFGLDPIGWHSEGIASTMGNPNHLGAYLCIALPLCIAVTLTEKRLWLRCVWGLFAVCGLFALVFSLTRAAWLGFAAAAVVMALLSTAYVSPLTIRRAGLSVLGLVAVLALYLAIDAGTRAKLIQRVTSISARSGTGAYRVHMWRTSLNALKESPWLGMGPSTFCFTYLLHQPLNPSAIRITAEQPENSVPDSPHNIFLEGALTSGVGYLFYLAVVIITFMQVRRVLRHPSSDWKARLIFAGVGASVAGYLVDGFFEIDVITLKILTWVLIGLTTGYASMLAESPAKRSTAATPPSVRSTRPAPAGATLWRIGGVVIGVCGAAGMLWFARVRQKADEHCAKGMALQTISEKYLAEGDVQGAIEYIKQAANEFEEAHRLLPVEREYGSRVITVNLSLFRNTGDEKRRKRSEEVAEALVRRYPADGFLRGDLATCYLAKEGKDREKSIDQAIFQLRCAALMCPNVGVFHYNLGIGLAHKKTVESLLESCAEFEKAIRMAVKSDLAKENLQQVRRMLKSLGS